MDVSVGVYLGNPLVCVCGLDVCVFLLCSCVCEGKIVSICIFMKHLAISGQPVLSASRLCVCLNQHGAVCTVSECHKSLNRHLWRKQISADILFKSCCVCRKLLDLSE